MEIAQKVPPSVKISPWCVLCARICVCVHLCVCPRKCMHMLYFGPSVEPGLLSSQAMLTPLSP